MAFVSATSSGVLTILKHGYQLGPRSEVTPFQHLRLEKGSLVSGDGLYELSLYCLVAEGLQLADWSWRWLAGQDVPSESAGVEESFRRLCRFLSDPGAAAGLGISNKLR